MAVPLNQPVGFRVRLAAMAVASGPDTHGLADFGANSFKLPTGRDACSLPDGVTVNAGTYLVNNRFFDPLRPVVGVPEPTTGALMLLGSSAIGVSRSGRRGLGSDSLRSVRVEAKIAGAESIVTLRRSLHLDQPRSCRSTVRRRPVSCTSRARSRSNLRHAGSASIAFAQVFYGHARGRCWPLE